ncbi:hypothetical protein FOG51_02396 [Hanseniaspora uvarum]|uniref:Pre-mRNA-splicing factor CWC25 n=1 Tax=Hanseniaspora uvarum TaxID=29833 RepID=A0A1E5S0Y9_HANUV|nr:hypothetical protein FOG48_02248 [Hanseniaspora uvarum]KAF0272672.1 hypothetical protein FOG51_02396 [Hanseniaspora uvarum]KAF0278530.1 hypothetical protein FOG50_00621 [Hanseniaspora uvarum]OEJ92633.1 hypothetical protein AWRI3580_g478 [Hanseniaspora uvarum]GMM40339.1 hypothetical protein DAHU10_012400 [Hanseniaspora uvarum]
MGVNDLNLLKSWNPNLLKNKQKVWKTRDELKQENLKIKELEEDIKDQKNKKNSLNWMYEANDVSSKPAKEADTLIANLLKDKKIKVKKEALSLKAKKVKTDQDIKDRKKKELKDEILNMQESKKIKKTKKKVTKFTSEDPMSQF